MNKQITDISSDNNYKNSTTNNSKKEVFNNKISSYSNNYLGFKDDPELYNYLYISN